MGNFYTHKAYIGILSYVNENLPRGVLEEPYFPDYKSVMIGIMGYQKEEKKFQKLCNDLIRSGYLNERRGSGTLVITEEGRDFLNRYFKFQMLGVFAKFTEIFNRNFSSIVSIFLLFISISSIVLSFTKK